MPGKRAKLDKSSGDQINFQRPFRAKKGESMSVRDGHFGEGQTADSARVLGDNA
jgi:hypothetical protein